MNAATKARAIRAGLVLATLAILVWIPTFYDSRQTLVPAKALTMAVAALGLNLLTGYSGQVSLGHGAFYALGGYTTAILMSQHNLQWTGTLPVVVVVAAVVGAAFGFPALRVKGLYLALVSLALAALTPYLATYYVPGLISDDYRRFFIDPNTVKSYAVLAPSWVPSSILDDQWRYYLALTTAVVMFALAANLVRGRFGRALVAVRDQETAATVIGVNAARVKIAAFALSAVYAAVAGSISVLIEPRSGASAELGGVFLNSILFLIAVVIGGAATVAGPAVGAVFVVYLQHFGEQQFADNPSVIPAAFGITLIVMMYFLPDGIVGGVRRVVRRRSERKAGPDLVPSRSTP